MSSQLADLKRRSSIMSMSHFLFTSESVTEGHPDKVADQISDSILDAIIHQDKTARVACETLVTTGLAFVAGEITTSSWVDIPEIVRQTIKEIGYNDSEMGFDWATCSVLTSIDKQSPDIAIGVNPGEGMFEEQGAGDQGLMFGYACNETPVLMPMPIYYAHRITRKLAEVRKHGVLEFLRPDGKSQVTIEYHNHQPKRVDTVVVAAQHTPNVSYKNIREGIIEEVIKKVIPAEFIDEKNQVLHQFHRPFRHWRPHGRLRIDGQENYCRYLWRTGKPRRWMFLGQRPFQGGSYGILYGPLRGQEHCCCRPRRQGRSAGSLQHRCGRARFSHDRYIWNR